MVHIYYEDKKIASLLELEVSVLRIIRDDGELWQIDPEYVQIEAIVSAS
jgi:hypothetical protein